MLSYIFDGTNPIKMAIYIEVFQLFFIKKNYLRGRGVYPKTRSLIFQVDLPSLNASS